MSTAEARTRPAWKVWAVVAVLVVVVAGLLHAWRNTNVLTADRLCGGWCRRHRPTRCFRDPGVWTPKGTVWTTTT